MSPVVVAGGGAFSGGGLCRSFAFAPANSTGCLKYTRIAWRLQEPPPGKFRIWLEFLLAGLLEARIDLAAGDAEVSFRFSDNRNLLHARFRALLDKLGDELSPILGQQLRALLLPWPDPAGQEAGREPLLAGARASCIQAFFQQLPVALKGALLTFDRA